MVNIWLVIACERYHQGYYHRRVLWLLLSSDGQGLNIHTTRVCHACQAVFVHYDKTLIHDVEWSGGLMMSAT